MSTIRAKSDIAEARSRMWKCLRIEGDCVIWTGSSNHGSPRISISKADRTEARFSVRTLYHLPDGEYRRMTLVNTCGNSLCLSHIERYTMGSEQASLMSAAALDALGIDRAEVAARRANKEKAKADKALAKIERAQAAKEAREANKRAREGLDAHGFKKVQLQRSGAYDPGLIARPVTMDVFSLASRPDDWRRAVGGA